MLNSFSGDWRIYKVVMASSNPIETLHKIRTKQYSIITFLDMLEMLDVQTTLKENEHHKVEIYRKNNPGRKG